MLCLMIQHNDINDNIVTEKKVKKRKRINITAIA